MAVVKCMCVIVFFVIILVCALTQDLFTPSLYIQDLYVPAFLDHDHPVNKTTPPLNASVIIDLKSKRSEAADDSFSYRDFDLTLFYGKDRRLKVANCTLPGFSLGNKRKAAVEAVVEAPGMPWEEAFREISSGLTVELVVELVVVSSSEECGGFFGDCFWEEKGPEVVAALVRVDGSGHKVSKKPIKLHR